jgi:hypothetical protein
LAIRWKSPAGDLKPGDRVEAQNGLLQVLATGVDLRVPPVYNLSVEDAETYFVGDLGAWVHNSTQFGGWPNQTIQNIMNEIIKREKELKLDVCNLPEYGPGPNRATRQGHRRIIVRLWKDFYKQWDKLGYTR